MSHPQPVQMDARSTNGNGTTHSDKNDHAADLSLSTAPFPASKKIYVQGTLPHIRVAMREIELTPTKTANGGAPVDNPSITVYDTSGPYTDPSVAIDIREGLA